MRVNTTREEAQQSTGRESDSDDVSEQGDGPGMTPSQRIPESRGQGRSGPVDRLEAEGMGGRVGRRHQAAGGQIVEPRILRQAVLFDTARGPCPPNPHLTFTK